MKPKNYKNKKQTKGGSNKPRKPNKKRPVTMSKTSYSLSDDVGQTVGNVVGKGVSMLGKWLGFGAYSINKNTLIGAGGTVPSMHSTSDSVIVRHREYIGDVNSSTTYRAVSIPLNPGQIDTFPWLSKMAQNYQQYRILGAVVEFIPELTEYASTGASLGAIALAAQYRTDLPAYPSLSMALESEFAVSGKPSLPLTLAIECDPKQSAYNTWYTRTGPVLTGEDVKTFDFCNLVAITTANPISGTILGQIWISYEIELMRPTAFLDPVSSNLYIHWTNTIGLTDALPLGTVGSGAYNYYNNPNGTNVIGTSYSQQASKDSFTLSNAAGVTTVTLPFGCTGSFEIVLQLGGTGVVGAGFDGLGSTFTNATSSPTIRSGSTQVYPSYGSTGSIATILIVTYFTISNAQASVGPAVITLSTANTKIPTAATVDLVLNQISSTI